MPDLGAAHRLELAGSIPSTSVLGLHTFPHTGTTQEPRFTNGRSEGLGASPHSFLRATKTAATVFALGATVTFSSDLGLLASSVIGYQTIIEVQSADQSTREPEERATDKAAVHRSIAWIRRALDDEAIEDGITHRAEARLASHVAAFGDSGLFESVKSAATPERAAMLLRLLGRSPTLSDRLRAGLVTWGLGSPNVEVRDAVVQSVENWSDRTLLPLLRNHVEPTEWLRDYVVRITGDLEA